jgi:hypothetical protein
MSRLEGLEREQRRIKEGLDVVSSKIEELNIGLDRFSFSDADKQAILAGKDGDNNSYKKLYLKKYRKESLNHHPDKGGDAEVFKVLNKQKTAIIDHIDSGLNLTEGTVGALTRRFDEVTAQINHEKGKELYSFHRSTPLSDTSISLDQFVRKAMENMVVVGERVKSISNQSSHTGSGGGSSLEEACAFLRIDYNDLASSFEGNKKRLMEAVIFLKNYKTRGQATTDEVKERLFLFNISGPLFGKLMQEIGQFYQAQRPVSTQRSQPVVQCSAAQCGVFRQPESTTRSAVHESRAKNQFMNIIADKEYWKGTAKNLSGIPSGAKDMGKVNLDSPDCLSQLKKIAEKKLSGKRSHHVRHTDRHTKVTDFYTAVQNANSFSDIMDNCCPQPDSDSRFTR